MFVGRHAASVEVVLLRLRSAFFGDFGIDKPEREAVKRAIAAALEECVPLVRAQGDEEEPDLSVDYLYARLRETGWLTEEEERWRIWVDMPPDCRRLIAMLAFLKEESAKSFTGLVSEVSTLLNAVIASPDRYVTNVDGAGRVAIAFRQRMAEIDANLSAFSRNLDNVARMDEAVLLFFNEFVHTRIVDWAVVMERNNPWRSRSSISGATRRLRRDHELMQKAACAYARAGHADDETQAEMSILARLDDIEKCFDDIERLRVKIEARQQAVENRLGNVLRYIGRNPAQSRQYTTQALAALGKLPDTGLMALTFRFTCHVSPFGDAVFADAREVFTPSIRKALRRHRPDPLYQDYLAACRAFDRLTSPSPRRLAAWLELADGRGDADPLSVSEWFAWRRCALLAQFDVKLDGWRLKRTDQIARCRYGALPGFTFEKED